MITTPYNFVPLSEKVVLPFWADQISHDVPFKDARSGTLRIKIKAESPIYVRNGLPKNAAENEKYRFNNFQDKCFIPGSSIRGMLRSVTEIMSFGKMKNKVDDVKYSVRDFQNNAIYPITEISNQAQCGWLYKIGDQFFIDECGKPGRISHKNLDILCNGKKISDHYKSRENVARDNQKSARSKYKNFTFDKTGHRFREDYESERRKIYKIDNDGQKGTIVLTGQPGQRNEPNEGKATGKHLEFIFWDKEPTKTPVSPEVIKNFLFAYYDHDKNSQKADWQWRKHQLDKGEKIPVFLRKTEEEIVDMGLTMLFKITYKHSVKDSINAVQKNSDGYDLAELIFGYTDGNKPALKGRVQVGHAFVSSGKDPMQLQTEVLAGPKASYYPNYIEQKEKAGKVSENYKTFMNNDAKIRGWKRYPVHNGNVKTNPPPVIRGIMNEKVATKFIPLPSATEFSFDIHYHNLRNEELGALISAITFHNSSGLFHSIGSAKPLGYGKISLTIEDGPSPESRKEMLKAYETFMDYGLGNSNPLWFQSEQIKELFAMAKPGKDDKQLKYMQLAEFAAAKGRRKKDPKHALPKYSVISGNNVEVVSLSTENDLHNASIAYEEEKAKYASLKPLEQVKAEAIRKAEAELNTIIQNKKESLLQKLNDLKIKVDENEKLDVLLQQAENCYNSENWKESLSKYRKIQQDFPEHETDFINNRISVIEKKISDNIRSEGLSFINNDRKFDAVRRELDQWLKKSDLEKVPEEHLKTLKEYVQNIYKNAQPREFKFWKKPEERGNWQKVSTWVGIDLAKSWYDEVKKD